MVSRWGKYKGKKALAGLYNSKAEVYSIVQYKKKNNQDGRQGFNNLSEIKIAHLSYQISFMFLGANLQNTGTFKISLTDILIEDISDFTCATRWVQTKSGLYWQTSGVRYSPTFSQGLLQTTKEPG